MAIGKVIKGDGSGELAGAAERSVAPRPTRAGVMNAEIFEARQSAQGIIEEANREKERILAEAQREREDVLAKAREQGRQEGGQRHPPPARDAHAKPGDGCREAHQRARQDHPVGLPRRQDRDQARRRQVPRPVRQGFPAHREEGSEGRIHAP